jgi:hypothetical protein
MPKTADHIIADLLDKAGNWVSGLALEAIGEDGHAIANRLWKVTAYLRNRTEPVPSFTCPCCGAVTYHPKDVAESYCGKCHWWMADPVLTPGHFADACEYRKPKPKPKPKAGPAVIREWAKLHGYHIRDTGRVPIDIARRYYDEVASPPDDDGEPGEPGKSGHVFDASNP